MKPVIVASAALSVPVPLFVGAAVSQMPADVLDGYPAWLAALAVVGWVVVSVLNMLGRLPYASSAKPGFTPDDRLRAVRIETEAKKAREAAQKTYDLLAWKDDDGVPRFIFELEPPVRSRRRARRHPDLTIP